MSFLRQLSENVWKWPLCVCKQIKVVTPFGLADWGVAVREHTVIYLLLSLYRGLPRLTQLVKNLPANVGDTRGVILIPDSGRSPRGGHGNPLEYSWLGNPTDRGVWRVVVHGVTESGTTECTHTAPTHIHLFLDREHLESKKYTFRFFVSVKRRRCLEDRSRLCCCWMTE